MTVKIAASLLSADFAQLGEEVRAVSPFADMIHLDVMDGHFVPNLTFGAPVIKALRSLTSLPFDVHLMISPVEASCETFAQAGANILTIHAEASSSPLQTLQKIRSLGCKAGLALKPKTTPEILKPLLSFIDLILVMTVEPGFGGQTFLEDQLAKIREVRTLIDKSGFPIVLEVDGGITMATAPAAINAGADVLVAGTSVFKGGPENYAANIEALRGEKNMTSALRE